jgi:S-adenosylmethionine hydrolase
METGPRPIVTFLSDFGERDQYVAAMKGVVLDRCREATLVDMTHEVPPGDVLRGALILAGSSCWFPAGAIHVAVVDPGVGTDRAALLIESADRFYIGPDNGLLSLAAGSASRIHRLDADEFFVHPVSSTFHGRDVFASVAGHLAAGRKPAELGTAIGGYHRIELPAVERAADSVAGEILYADAFGNLVTNIGAGDLAALGADPIVDIAGGRRVRLCRAYADARSGALVALIGSTALLEIAVTNGSAQAALVDAASPGTRVRVTRAAHASR